MKKPKIYIAGPMSERSNLNDEAFFKAEKRLQDKYTVLNPARRQLGLTYEDYIRQGIILLLQAEVIYCLRGWSLSRGADAEEHLARVLSLEMIFEED
ncbi:DUF4406 domain-containing protein [Gammaproteobacteria bacterium]